MSNHTPAPWAVVLDGFREITGDSHWCCEIKGPGDRASLVKLQDSHHCSPDYGISAEETQANAHLIAAAPELLAALKELVTGHSMKGAEIALAAIAKAEGKSL